MGIEDPIKWLRSEDTSLGQPERETIQIKIDESHVYKPSSFVLYIRDAKDGDHRFDLNRSSWPQLSLSSTLSQWEFQPPVIRGSI